MNPTIVVIIGIIVIFTIIYHVLKRIYFNQLVEQEKRAFHLIRKKRALWWLSPFYSNPLRKSKVKQMNRKRKHKIKQKQRDNFLTTVGLKPDQPTKTHFHHLKSIVHTHQKKNINQTSPLNLEQLEKKIKQWEQNKPLSNQEKEKILQELKKISSK